MGGITKSVKVGVRVGMLSIVFGSILTPFPLLGFQPSDGNTGTVQTTRLTRLEKRASRGSTSKAGAAKPQHVPPEAPFGSDVVPEPGVQADDPVYAAWEAFLQQREAKGAETAVVDVEAPSTAPAGGAVLTSPGRGNLSGGSWGTLAATMFGGVGLLGAFLARRHVPKLAEWIGNRAREGGTRSKVQVISVSPLSSQGSVAVVSIYDRVLVLGVTSTQVSLLTAIDTEVSSEAAIPARREEVPSALAQPRARVEEKPTADFSELLDNLVGNSRAGGVDAGEIARRYVDQPAPAKVSRVEPPMEDLAGQVLRKMRTMKRFRASA